MYRIALAHNHYSQDHLNKVVKEMETLGAPTIRVYDATEDTYQAIEGCHRLRACEILGIEPMIEVLDKNTLVADLQDFDFEGNVETIAEIGDYENYKITIE